MSYNGSGTFVINSSGQPVVTGTVISSTAFNALTADLATGLSTAITKDGQTTTTARIVFAQGVSSTLVTDATSATTGSIITAGGISTQKALWVGTTSTLAGAITYGGITLSNSVTGTGSMVLSASPTLTGSAAGQANNAASETYWQVLNNSASNGAFAILRASNGTSNVDFGMTGTGYGGVGAYIANQAYIRCDAANGVGIYAPTGPIKFVGSGFSEVARIDTSGALLIGRTAAINSEAFCASNSTATTATGYIYKSAVQTAGSTFVVRSEGVAGTGWQLYEGMAQSGGTVFYVQGNGNVKNTNNSYGAISDIALKENIADATPKLADLMNVKIRNYNFKSDDTKRKQIGVIAQELETVFPAMVDIDSKGNKTVGYSIFVPMLIKAIQELTTRLAALETK
jgi:hypothetical protein